MLSEPGDFIFLNVVWLSRSRLYLVSGSASIILKGYLLVIVEQFFRVFSPSIFFPSSIARKFPCLSLSGWFQRGVLPESVPISL